MAKLECVTTMGAIIAMNVIKTMKPSFQLGSSTTGTSGNTKVQPKNTINIRKQNYQLDKQFTQEHRTNDIPKALFYTL